MKNKISEIEIEFLDESNAIEDVRDGDSLQQAIRAWSYLRKQPKLTTGVILKTHKILMLYQPLFPNERGYWRREPVWIGGHEGKPWYVVPELMLNWVEQANNSVEIGKKYSEEDLQKDHIDFERIHPFIDGNGRIGRMLFNWQRLKIGKEILVFREDEKENYYKWFLKANS